MSSDETVNSAAPSEEVSTPPAVKEAPATETAASEPAVIETPVSEAPVETPAAEPVVAAAAPAEAVPPTESVEEAAAAAQAAEEAARKVELKPKSDENFKAVAAKTLAEPDDLETAIDVALSQVTNVLPVESTVEIPSDVDLGDLESEIAAAMQTDEQKAEATPEGSPDPTDLPHQGQRLQAVIQSIHGDDVFLDLGSRIPGVLQRRQFEGLEPPEVGKQLSVVVSKVDENQGLIAVNMPGGKSRPGGNWDAVEKGQIVDVTVTKTNKGGLEVMVGSLRGFMPAGQVDLRFVENLEPYIGQKLQAKVTEKNPAKKNLVVSRRAILIDQRKELEVDFWSTIEEGQEFTGQVKTLKDYGAFVDLGGADGFLHIGQISWTHITNPNEVLTEGQEVNVLVLKVEKDKKKVSLGMKQLSQDPWVEAAEKYTPDTVITGRVTRTADFGAFVELEPAIEGLIHISELDWKRVRKVTDVVKEGQEVQAKVLDFDSTKRRVSLSLKAMSTDPKIAEEAAAEAAAEEAAKNAPPRKAREDLRGGIGAPASSGGGLFGNPTDFT